MRTTKSLHIISSFLLIIVFNGILFIKKSYAGTENNLSITVNKYNLLCNNDNTGLIDVEIKGGTKPYQFSWSNNATSEDMSGLSAGTYNLIVADAAGNTLEATIEIGQPEKINIDAVVLEDINSKNAGSIKLNVRGGVGSYQYLWNDNSEKSSLSNLEEGVYAVKVTDKNQCFETALFRVKASEKLNARADVYDLLCNKDNTGAIDLTIKGGRTPCTFNWSHGASTEDVTELAEGNYSVVITDAAGQKMEKYFKVNQPDQLIVMATVTDESIRNAANGNAIIDIAGGAQPYRINWETGATERMISNLHAGTYAVTVVDAHLCSVSHNILVVNADAIAAEKRINPTTDNSLFVFPNPATDYVMVNGGDEKIVSATLYDLKGSSVKSVTSIQNNIKIDVSNLPATVYLLKIIKESGTEIQKIAKTN